MTELKLRRRNRLRRKEVESLAAELNSTMGTETFQATDAVETGEAGGNQLVTYKGKPVGIFINEKPFLTVHGLLMFGAARKHVTVDMGAVKYLANGADVMAPGIIDADPEIKEGDAVWVRDQNNLRPLLVGIALMDGPGMVAGKGGKAVKTVHYVGDKIWNLPV
ncbi:MAG: RNA-binding protein [Candidatus Thermoplasmatota archaeon]|nr:RNA-binding protein [Euryarchaeota archaeon]MBU4032756.1 RNA-binding protein [Candidatus Thermoplasmatota archaeon]MBU4070854.1 RNA-binding protein [Candidatus Thermoplasmatota archaeon]MBU4143413.1 RNA-binding protein [Candidatus Thermoplasmatota archaeon]MBU4592442.1 RNA-binding protein [Candidatus Thermoplasmatota archaeon]